MVNLQTSIEAGLVIREVKLEAAAKAKIDELTRIRLGIAPGFAPSGGQLATTAAAMGKAGIGGQTGLMGMAASLTTLVSSITGLASIIMLAISNSKIIAMLSGTIGKALGLLVDVILMPFLPIFMIILVGLFKAIMEFYKWWKGIISPSVIKAIEDIGAVLKRGLEVLWNMTMGAFIDSLGEAGGFLLWLWEIMTTGDKGTVKFKVDVLSKLSDALEWIRGGVASLTVYITEIVTKGLGQTSDANIMANDAINEIQYALGIRPRPPEWMSNPTGDFRPDMKFARGGVVPRTGVALVHKGETVIPKGGGGITVNITGQFKTDEEMYKRFVDRLRQEQWRTNV